MAAFRRAQFGPAGTVEFAGGTANLLTGAAALASQWQNVPHGNRIILGVIANQDEHDDRLLMMTLLGGNAGLLGTALVAPQYDISQTRARVHGIHRLGA